MREHNSIDADWLFYAGDPEHAMEAEFDDSGWEQVNLPHDWSIHGTYDKKCAAGMRGAYLPTGVGWYRKHVEVPVTDLVSDKRISVTFDGVYRCSDVWINGTHLGCRPNGYIGFQYELTPHLRQGTNVIAVRVDTSKAPSGRWYTGSGIYRHVWWTVTSDIHVPKWGTWISTPEIGEASAQVQINTVLMNGSDCNRQVDLITRMIDETGMEVACYQTAADLNPAARTDVVQFGKLSNPNLWSPDHPYLYKAITEIVNKANGELLDTYETAFGIRHIRFDSREGFVLNGRQTNFQGVCLHQDAGVVGTAVPDHLLEQRLRLLKQMGCNAIRTGHHPFAPEFYAICDRLGFMVMDEAFDGWGMPKAEFDYGHDFAQWWERDLTDLLLRDRNHPSVMMWSVGNEVKEMDEETARKLIDLCHRLDPTRPVTCGIQGTSEHADKMRSLFDVAGYNDGGGACFVYERDHERHPERVCVATEAPHTFQTRGFYRTQTWWRDKDQPRIEIDNLTEEELFFDGHLAYNSSYDNSGVRTSARDSWKFVKQFPFLTGEFRWTGFDYLGESFGWPARMANFGIIDAANIPKDHYYFYQSQFTRDPMIHLLPHWTHPGLEGREIPVWVYTNCESAELTLNGKSLGKKVMGEEMYLSWLVPYEPGELRVLGWKDGNVVEQAVTTAGDPSMIDLSIDLAGEQLAAESNLVAQVSIVLVDEAGNLVPHGHNTVHMRAEGPVRFLGMENGDPVDTEPHYTCKRKAFYGKAMGLFQSTEQDGEIEVTSAGILGDTVFRESTLVHICISRISLRGTLPTRAFCIRYTLNGDAPDLNAAEYIEPVQITESCVVKAAVYDLEGRLIFLMEETFSQGERKPVIDLTHSNKKRDRFSSFQGPFAREVACTWQADEDSFELQENGDVIHHYGGGYTQHVGYWWYEFPADPFEAPEYAGKGEILWDTGIRTAITLRSQEGSLLDMAAADGTVTWIKQKQSRLSRMEE